MSKEISNKNQIAVDAIYRFGNFELRPNERLLTRNGEPVALVPKAFDTLLVLVRRAGHLVSKGELMETVWASTYVADTNLTNIIVSLRKILGRDAIRTVSKHGYRFVMNVESGAEPAGLIHQRFARARELALERSVESTVLARELCLLCIAQDPSFAPAWAWLGRTSYYLAKFRAAPPVEVEVADAAFRRAFALDPDLPEAHQFYTPLETDTGHARRAMFRLLRRVQRTGGEAQSFAGLVQVFRYCGLLDASLEAHRRAVQLDPTVVTSVPHTWFLTCKYAQTIETYGGRTGSYLDAAAWAALGEKNRAVTLLRDRLASTSWSALPLALMSSLLHVLEGRHKEAFGAMNALGPDQDPEALVYFARHYAYMGSLDAAMDALRRASKAGFICPPPTLRCDEWLRPLQTHPGFSAVMGDLTSRVNEAGRHLHGFDWPAGETGLIAAAPTGRTCA